jgi:hypothetical protein
LGIGCKPVVDKGKGAGLGHYGAMPTAFWVRDAREFERIRAYILNNPVKAGLVRTAEEYPWCGLGVETSLDGARTSARATETFLDAGFPRENFLLSENCVGMSSHRQWRKRAAAECLK